jgi:DNA-binding NtrC family response regulator
VDIVDRASLPGNQRAEPDAEVGNFSGAAEYSPRLVLVVDDEPLIRWSVSETLRDLGLDVEQAVNANDALRAVTGSPRPFDIVVLDLRLPDMHDLSLLGTLRQALPKASLIMMTAMATADIIRGAQALGATVLHKPFELDALRHLVRETEID